MNDLFMALLLISLVGLVIGLVKPSLVKQSGRKRVLTIFGGGFILFFILFGVTSSNKPQEVTTDQKQARVKSTPSSTRVATATKTPQAAATPAPTKTPQVGFGNGTHVVNTDINPGTYRSQSKGTCYWARLSGFGGQISDIIANGNNSPEIVTVSASDAAFQTSGCGQWVPVENTYPATPAISFSDGTYAVGHHISAGTYRADGSPDSLCYWARLSNFSHAGVTGIISNGNASTVIQIAAGDAGFTAFGCGTWTKVQ